MSDVVTPDELEARLKEMPKAMMSFSRGLRSLYNEQAVCQGEDTASFRKIRDDVRNDAAIYVTTVLPLAELVVTNIIAYFDVYKDFSYEEWADLLEDIVEDMKGYEKGCQLLEQMHVDLMTTIKKRQDVAQVAIVEMEELSRKFEQEMASLHQAAADEKQSAASWSMWGNILAPATLGISKLICDGVADSKERASRMSAALAVAKSANSEIIQKAEALTKDVLMPAIADFLKGLQACYSFFATNKAQLVIMKDRGQTALERKRAGERLQLQYKAMQKKAQGIQEGCNNFLGSIGWVKSDLAAIPLEGAEKNYVDNWVTQQMLKYQEEQRDSSSSVPQAMLRALGLSRLAKLPAAATAGDSSAVGVGDCGNR